MPREHCSKRTNLLLRYGPGGGQARVRDALRILMTSQARWASLVAFLLIGLTPAAGPAQPADGAQGTAAPATGGAPGGPAPTAADRRRMEALARTVTIYRDTWGVPHVVGITDESAMFGAAYARAEDQLPEDEPFFLDALGRRAELDGEEAFAGDRLVRAYRIPELAKAEYDAAPPKIRAMAEAYADGVNYFLLRNPGVQWQVLDRFEPWYVFAFYRLDAGPWLAGPAERVAFRRPAGPSNGSNAWAVGPSRTASGHAMLFSNTHMRFNVPYEFHVPEPRGAERLRHHRLRDGRPSVRRAQRAHRLDRHGQLSGRRRRVSADVRRPGRPARLPLRRRTPAGRGVGGDDPGPDGRRRRGASDHVPPEPPRAGLRGRAGRALRHPAGEPERREPVPALLRNRQSAEPRRVQGRVRPRAARLPQLRLRRRRGEHLLSVRRRASPQGSALRLGTAGRRVGPGNGMAGHALRRGTPRKSRTRRAAGCRMPTPTRSTPPPPATIRTPRRIRPISSGKPGRGPSAR